MCHTSRATKPAKRRSQLARGAHRHFLDGPRREVHSGHHKKSIGLLIVRTPRMQSIMEDNMLSPLRSQGAALLALVLGMTLFGSQPLRGQTFNVIHTFNGTDGAGPIGSLA